MALKLETIFTTKFIKGNEMGQAAKAIHAANRDMQKTARGLITSHKTIGRTQKRMLTDMQTTQQKMVDGMARQSRTTGRMLKLTGLMRKNFTSARRAMADVEKHGRRTTDQSKRVRKNFEAGQRAMRGAERSSRRMARNSRKTKGTSIGPLDLARHLDLGARSATRARYAMGTMLVGGAFAAGGGMAARGAVNMQDERRRDQVGLANAVNSTYGVPFEKAMANSAAMMRQLAPVAAKSPGTTSDFTKALSQLMISTGLGAKDAVKLTQGSLIGGALSRGTLGAQMVTQDIVTALQTGNIDNRNMKDLAFMMRATFGSQYETMFDEGTREQQMDMLIRTSEKMTSMQGELNKVFDVQMTTLISHMTELGLIATAGFTGTLTGGLTSANGWLQDNQGGLRAGLGPMGKTFARMAPALGAVTVGLGMVVTMFVVAAAVLPLIGSAMAVGLPIIATMAGVIAGLTLAVTAMVGWGMLLWKTLAVFPDLAKDMREAFESMMFATNELLNATMDFAQHILTLMGPALLELGYLMGTWLVWSLDGAADSARYLTETLDSMGKVATRVSGAIKEALLFLQRRTGRDFGIRDVKEESPMLIGFAGGRLASRQRESNRQAVEATVRQAGQAGVLGKVHMAPGIVGMHNRMATGSLVQTANLTGFAQRNYNLGAAGALSSFTASQLKKNSKAGFANPNNRRAFERDGTGRSLLEDLKASLEDLTKAGKGSVNIGEVNVQVQTERLDNPTAVAVLWEDMFESVIQRPVSASSSPLRE